MSIANEDQRNLNPDTKPALDPHLSELIGFAEACRATGFSYWTFHNAYRAGRITGVEVPGGAIGLLREDVQRFTLEHRARLDERKNQKRERAKDAR